MSRGQYNDARKIAQTQSIRGHLLALPPVLFYNTAVELRSTMLFWDVDIVPGLPFAWPSLCRKHRRGEDHEIYRAYLDSDGYTRSGFGYGARTGHIIL